MSIELERTDDILKYLGEHKVHGTVFVWIFHGNPKYARVIPEPSWKEKPGYGCSQ